MKAEDLNMIERSATVGITIGLIIVALFVALLIYANVKEEK